MQRAQRAARLQRREGVYLAYISPIPRLQLAQISPISRPYLACSDESRWTQPPPPMPTLPLSRSISRLPSGRLSVSAKASAARAVSRGLRMATPPRVVPPSARLRSRLVGSRSPAAMRAWVRVRVRVIVLAIGLGLGLGLGYSVRYRVRLG